MSAGGLGRPKNKFLFKMAIEAHSVRPNGNSHFLRYAINKLPFVFCKAWLRVDGIFAIEPVLTGPFASFSYSPSLLRLRAVGSSV